MKALSLIADLGLATHYGSNALTAATWWEAAVYAVPALAYGVHVLAHRQATEPLPEMSREVDVRAAGARLGRGSMWL